jgi:hypothetical protein
MDIYNVDFPFVFLHQIIKEKLPMWFVLCHENVQGAGNIFLAWLQNGG